MGAGPFGDWDGVRNVGLSVLFKVYFQKRDGALTVFENTPRRNGVPQAVISPVGQAWLEVLWVRLRCPSIVSLLWAWASQVPTPYQKRDPQGPIRTTMKTPGHCGVAVTLRKFGRYVHTPPGQRGRRDLPPPCVPMGCSRPTTLARNARWRLPRWCLLRNHEVSSIKMAETSNEADGLIW